MKRSDQWPERNNSLFGWDKFQQIANFTIENRADSRQHINVKTSNFVVAVMIDLSPLHFCAMTQLILADTGFLDQFIQFDTNGSVFFHYVYPYPSNVAKCRMILFDISSVYKLDLKYKF